MRNELATLSQSSQDLIEKLQDAIDAHDSALRFNMCQIVRHFLWKLCLENDSNKDYGKNKHYMAGDLDKIIETAIKTSCYTNRADGEDYPIWDKKEVSGELERVMNVLIKAKVAM